MKDSPNVKRSEGGCSREPRSNSGLDNQSRSLPIEREVEQLVQSRRSFVSASGALVLSSALTGCQIFRGKTPSDDSRSIAHEDQRPRGSYTWVDTHCHIFNARDIPIQGFLHEIHLKGFFGYLGRVADRTTSYLAGLQADAPTAQTEVDWIGQFDDRPPISDISPTNSEVRRALNQLRKKEKIVRRAAKKAAKKKGGARRGGGNVPHPKIDTSELRPLAYGLASWKELLVKYRYEIALHFMDFYPEVKLFTPSILDMQMWFDNKDLVTPIEDQIEVYSIIVRKLEGRCHPIIGFDPLRASEHEGAIEESTSFRWVEQALKTGFIGVKVYPPLGFRPLRNSGVKFRTPQDFLLKKPIDGLGDRIDASLRHLYAWCDKNEVPIMTHSSLSNGRTEDEMRMAHPIRWASVLSECPSLRVNLGHFGGSESFWESKEDSRAWVICQLMDKYENVYADIGYHDVFLDAEQEEIDEYVEQMNDMLDAFPVLGERLMYGSDWQMIMLRKGARQYSANCERVFTDRIKADFSKIAGENALRFYGLDNSNPISKSRKRLLTFYLEADIDLPEWWVRLPGEGPSLPRQGT